MSFITISGVTLIPLIKDEIEMNIVTIVVCCSDFRDLQRMRPGMTQFLLYISAEDALVIYFFLFTSTYKRQTYNIVS